MSDDVKLETWVNESKSLIGVLKLDPIKGTRVDLVQPGRQILVTPEERRLTEDAVAKQADNPFRNGRFSPTHLVEDAEDVAAIRDNPNVISRGAIDDLLKAPVKTMESRLNAIDSADALQRILDVANEEGAATRKLQSIRDRITAVKGPGTKTTAPNEPVFAGAEREPWYPEAGASHGGGTAVGEG